ncbi:Putative DNA/pantothenate metabolism flavoprotein [Septoria linicola]|uniref:DNA/pantothenate metabolism flavoprotein n=1 Tax=Septoria linicola TaxID=215465 RepID=A0A9Q9AMF3_9PEZI|nr:putative DNA/pantothenate metabolism flavoprotein [Septoria linicola]USW50784.1 Putative DNA/pantothenate metabolism flavoprotein [Septoria linicola]
MEYFDANPKPQDLDEHNEIARAFINQHAHAKRRVALVTSGGTTVPLENQTVRFIDNFSAGTRGATSAEYFLENGYAVIFLHRQFSLLPYSRHYSHSTNCFLDYMSYSEDGPVAVQSRYQHQMGDLLKRYRKAKKENTLLLLPFVTVNEYLWHLRDLATLMHPLGANALFYLAAAVSDFFVPAERMVEHKIQSSEDFNKKKDLTDGDRQQTKEPAAHMDGKLLKIDLDPVPKFLKLLVDGWAPRAMIVSFKLETDPALLKDKCAYALKKYAHHLVIGNMLNTRKFEVLFVSAGGGEKWIRVPQNRRQKSVSAGVAEETGEEAVEIESLIIPEVKALHTHLIEKGDPRRLSQGSEGRPAF